MKLTGSGNRERYLLPLALGLSDGILTALLLTAGRIVGAVQPLTFLLVVRVAVAAIATAGFVLFVARFAELRQGLARAERHLNLLERGQLATTRLGRDVLRDSFKEALVAGTCSFLGAAFPLVVGLIFPHATWVAVAVAIGALSVLGAVLAIPVRGHPLRWAVGMALSGVALTALGMWLDLV